MRLENNYYLSDGRDQAEQLLPLSGADFLFPRDLQVTPTDIKNVLIVGSCAAGVWALKIVAPNVHFDYLIMNNAGILPEAPPLPVGEYDFQLVQLTLRSVIWDRIVRFYDFLIPEKRQGIISDAMNALAIYLDACLGYNEKHGLLTFVINFPVPQRSASAALDHIGTEADLSTLVRMLNERLAVLVSQRRNAFIADYNSIGNSMGKRYFSNDALMFFTHNTFWHPGHREFDLIPARITDPPEIESIYPSHLSEMLRTSWQQWEGLYRTANQLDAVKLVIFDLDDTLWRGQIAEHYGDDGEWPSKDGWPTGIWEAVHHLRARGIMVAICSKNEESIVRSRWERALIDGWLSLDDFLFKEINWNPKAENIRKIIKQASLTPKSVVFVDDNPVERESVRLALPGIRVIGENPYTVRRILLWAPETQVARLSDEAARREDMVRQQVNREVDREVLTREQFLMQLACRVRICSFNSADHADYPRSFELLNKTNQFNTTGTRWTGTELIAFFCSGGRLFAFTVEDRYTKYGLVGVILFKDGEFVQFVMSCRVLGMDVEGSVLRAIAKSEAERFAVFSASVKETAENIVSRDVYLRNGFGKASADGTFILHRGDLGGVASHLTLAFEP